MYSEMIALILLLMSVTSIKCETDFYYLENDSEYYCSCGASTERTATSVDDCLLWLLTDPTCKAAMFEPSKKSCKMCQTLVKSSTPQQGILIYKGK